MQFIKLLPAGAIVAASLLASPALAAPFVAELYWPSRSTDGPKGAGEILTYTATVRNHGPDQADNLVLAVTLPNELAFESLDISSGTTCTTPSVGATGTVSCTTTQLAKSADVSFALKVMVSPTAVPGSTITTTFTTSSSAATPYPENGIWTDDMVVSGAVSAVPTLTEWAMIFLGVALACTATLKLRRRTITA